MESINGDILTFVTTSTESETLSEADWSNGNGWGEGNGEGLACGGFVMSGVGIADKVTSSSELRGLYSLEGRVVYHLEDMPVIIYAVRGPIARAAFVQTDMTLKDGYIAKYKESFAFGEHVKEAYNKVKELSKAKEIE